MFVCFQKFLGDYSENLFTETKALQAIANFKVKLDAVTERINLRNRKLEVPYTYLLPGRIPNGLPNI